MLSIYHALILYKASGDLVITADIPLAARIVTRGGVALDPLLYSMLDCPSPWFRDVLMGGGGVVCLYLLVKFRDEL